MAVFSLTYFRHSWKKGLGRRQNGDKVNSTPREPTLANSKVPGKKARRALDTQTSRRRSGVVGGRCFFVLEDPSDGLQDGQKELEKLPLARRGVGARPVTGSPHLAETKSGGVRWDTQVVCWCGLSLA